MLDEQTSTRPSDEGPTATGDAPGRGQDAMRPPPRMTSVWELRYYFPHWRKIKTTLSEMARASSGYEEYAQIEPIEKWSKKFIMKFPGAGKKTAIAIMAALPMWVEWRGKMPFSYYDIENKKFPIYNPAWAWAEWRKTTNEWNYPDRYLSW